MDINQSIATSKICDILSSGNLIPPEIDIWKKIFYNAGLNDLYDSNNTSLQCRCIDSYYQTYKHNSKCYSTLYNILITLDYSSTPFIKLFKSIASKINIYNIINEDFEKKIRKKDIVKYLETKDLNYKLSVLRNYPNIDFKYLRYNLNILGIDFTFDENFLTIYPFCSNQESKEKTLLTNWLEKDYPNIFNSYKSALKAYSYGDAVGTLTHCRNILTGFCTYEKLDFKGWYTGLQKICNLDKNINNIVSPNNIPQWPNTKRDSSINYEINETNKKQINKLFNYPRFKLITQLYSYLCDLGDHTNDAPKINGIIEHEVTYIPDALMGLRITESVLLWIYQNKH